MEPVGVGDELAEMSLFISGDLLTVVPLEATYQATWAAAPEELRRVVEAGVEPEHESH